MKVRKTLTLDKKDLNSILEYVMFEENKDFIPYLLFIEALENEQIYKGIDSAEIDTIEINLD